MYSYLSLPDVDLPAGLAVRPDVLVVAVTARIEDVSPSHAVSMLKSAAGTLQSRLLAVHAGIEVSARKLDLGRHDIDKTAKQSLANANMSGAVNVPLEASADYWARAELVAKLSETLRALTVEFAKARQTIRFGFRHPVPRIRDVTPYRAELVARYNAHLRALTNGVSSIAMGKWDIPDDVIQQVVSLEEVRLILAPSLRNSDAREG